MQDQSTPAKPLSGFQRRKLKQAMGLPRYVPAEIAARQAYSNRRSRRRVVERRAMLDALKVERGCADCGYNAHPAALEFDHLPGKGKVTQVARYTAWGNKRTMLEEIARCEVVCANCHRIRTHERGQQPGGRRPKKPH